MCSSFLLLATVSISNFPKYFQMPEVLLRSEHIHQSRDRIFNGSCANFIIITDKKIPSHIDLSKRNGILSLLRLVVGFMEGKHSLGKGNLGGDGEYPKGEERRRLILKLP